MASPIGRTFMLVINDDHAPNIEWLHQKTLQINDQLSEWGIIHHDLDQGTPHYHVAIKYINPTRLTTVASHYEQAENLVKLWRRNDNNMWAYMTHQTKEAKGIKVDYQPFLDDSTKSLWSSEKTKEKARYNPNQATPKDKIERICKQILQGKLTERELLGEDLIVTYWQNKSKIDQAIQLRTKSLRFNPPPCRTIYIQGPSGVGKSTYAQKTAEKLYEDDYARASSSNDPLQDYAGEKCLIIDDWRPKNYEFEDLLALLDPYQRARTHKSRYFNKPLATELIIITSNMTLNNAIEHYTSWNNEDPHQIRRRIQTLITMETATDITIEKYDEQLQIYYVEQPDVI